MMVRTLAPLTALLMALFPSVVSAQTLPAQNAPAELACVAPAEFVGLGAPLWRMRAALAAGEPVVIVAVGSSSTEGAGASSPANTYPARLQVELRALLPGADITVLNRGIGGEDAAEMLIRFASTVIREQPDLVIWQVGTNAVLREQRLDGEAPLIRSGIKSLKASQADVVLMDSQYAPKVLAKPDIHGMVDMMAKKAKEESTGLFRRFAIMRHWRESQRIPFEALLSPDGLHMNDWSYGCIAKLLARSIAEAVRSPAGVARARPGR
jgi:acyl-CoA thioesterase I